VDLLDVMRDRARICSGVDIESLRPYLSVPLYGTVELYLEQ